MPSLSLPNRPKPYVMAHRGNRVACPENTLAAFKRAVAEGADLLETDLHLTTDGEFVCIHDHTLERTTNGTGLVEDKSLAELQQLSASYGRTEFAAERIPTLRDVAALMPPDCALGLELKSDHFLKPEVCHRFVQVLEECGIRNRAVVMSFNAARVHAVRAVAPDIPIGYITMSDAWPGADAQLLGPFWPLLLVNPLYVWDAHRRGRLVCPLDPTPDGRLWFYKWLGCDAILTDDPGETLKALGR